MLKAKSLEAEYEAKLEFPIGRGDVKQKPSVGEYGYFLKLRIIHVESVNMYRIYRCNAS